MLQLLRLWRRQASAHLTIRLERARDFRLVLLMETEARMPRYYFDMRDADGVVPDEEGMELDTMKAVQQEAAQVLPIWRETRSGNTPTAP